MFHDLLTTHILKLQFHISSIFFTHRMKNLILAFEIFFASFAFSVAQQSASSTQQSASSMPQLAGRYFIQGSLGFSYSSYSAFTSPATIPDPGDPNTTVSYSITPSGGYCLTNQWAIGLEVSYQHSQYNQYSYDYSIKPIKLYSTSTTISNYLSIAPLLRYSLPVVDKFIFTLSLTVPFSTSKETMNYATDTVTYPTAGETITSYGATIRPGLQWFVTDKIAVVGNMGILTYSHQITDQTSSNPSNLSMTRTSNDLYLSLTSNFSLGVVFYWGEK